MYAYGKIFKVLGSDLTAVCSIVHFSLYNSQENSIEVLNSIVALGEVDLTGDLNIYNDGELEKLPKKRNDPIGKRVRN